VQRVEDFLRRRPSSGLGDVIPSYTPGVTPTELDSTLPEWAIAAIREAIPAFDRKLSGFAMADAILTGVETRTSSPIRIPRHEESLQSVSTPGLFPAGEGAGFAGGILSSAIDGIRVAEAVAVDMLRVKDVP
ncbi:MAG: FAD-dependent oxidoreductase, partial [Acidobacteria bacterium]|nr:FAD-dependent oxidoreductase [Acidobacteriota bacterium]